MNMMFYKAATRGIFLCNRKTDKNEVKVLKVLTFLLLSTTKNRFSIKKIP